VPFAHVLYACDHKWWKKHFNPAWALTGLELWTQDVKAHREFGTNWVLGRGQPGLGLDCVHFGGNSGYQAINLAFLWGAKRIVLLGFDCKRVEGKDHWFGQHPKGLTQLQPYEIWINHFNKLAVDLQSHGVEVVNCSLDSALECFPKMDIEAL
jgi:hypothetical protein